MLVLLKANWFYHYHFHNNLGTPKFVFVFFFHFYSNFSVCHYNNIKNVIKFNQVILCNMQFCNWLYAKCSRKRGEERWRWEGEWDERSEMTLSVTDVRVSSLLRECEKLPVCAHHLAFNTSASPNQVWQAQCLVFGLNITLSTHSNWSWHTRQMIWERHQTKSLI